MSFEKFQILKSTVVPLPIENVDTDQIIPARFLKAVEEKDLETIFSEIGDIKTMKLPIQILF